MGPIGEVLVGLAILVGLFGIVLPLLPGLALVVGAIVLWAVLEGGVLAWTVAIAAVLLGGAGTVVKYVIPKRRLSASGIPTRALLPATGLAIIGFFAIPVVGGPIGFVVGIYLMERMRLGRQQAWPATRVTLGAVATSIGIELATALIISGVWLVVVLFA